MHSITSCGAVCFTRENGAIRYCVIRQTNGDYGFPKGHMEPGESERQTALREIAEEMGLTVNLLDGFREEIAYPMAHRPDRIKRVVYFLAEFSGQTPSAQPDEVTQVMLLSYRQAMDTLSFAQTKQILEKADRCLSAM